MKGDKIPTSDLRPPASSAIPEWLQREAAAYDLPLATPPRTVLDIGANIGAFALRAAKMWPDAKIFAFEPVPFTAEILKANVAGLSNIDTQDMAVRSFTGTDMILLGDIPAVHGFHQLGRQNHGKCPVSCIDAKLLPSAEFVKIDTEGCELEIIERLDLSETVALCCEYHRGRDIAPIKKICLAAGLELVDGNATWATGGHLKFARPGSLSVPTSDLRPPTSKKVFIALCGHYSQSDMIFVQSLCATIARRPMPIQIGWNCDPCLVRARNVLCAEFLATNCTHLLFIDSDIGFTPEDIVHICSHDAPVVGGMYPLKREGELKWCGNGVLDRPTEPDENGLQEVRYIGTGFLCIARAAFEKILQHDRAEIEYTSEDEIHKTQWAFFREGVRETADARKRWLTEDWFFCQRWLELGGQVFADTHVVLRHAGRAVWPLKTQGFDDIFGASQEVAEPRSGPGHRPLVPDAETFPGSAGVSPASDPQLSTN